MPVEVRRKLGVGPGSILEWDEAGGNIVVRRAAGTAPRTSIRLSSPARPAPRTLDDLKNGIRRSIRKRHARD